MLNIQQCKVKIEPPKQKRNIAQCANCQRYGHTKIYCHLKPKCVKCAGSQSTTQCPARKDQMMSTVSSVEEAILPTTRVARYTRTSNRRPSHHFVQKSTLLSPLKHLMFYCLANPNGFFRLSRLGIFCTLRSLDTSLLMWF
jgi:hypothetical protein